MSSRRILVVDDEPVVTMTLSEGLGKLGDDFTIEVASSGDEALAKVRQNKYMIMITDYKMPGMSGLDLAREVREVSPDTQIVLMTAYGNIELRDQAGQLELDGFLDKPFNITEIRDLVEQAAREGADPRRILIMEDDKDLGRIFSKALRRAGYDVHVATTIQEAHKLLGEQRFDVFLSDVQIGDERGTDLVREQGEALRKKGTQIIMVSAEAKYRPLTEDMGVDFYLEKPIALGALVTLVERLTAQH